MFALQHISQHAAAGGSHTLGPAGIRVFTTTRSKQRQSTEKERKSKEKEIKEEIKKYQGSGSHDESGRVTSADRERFNDDSSRA